MEVVVNFLSQAIFIFPLSLGMVIYANEFEMQHGQILKLLTGFTATFHFKSSVVK